MSGVQKREDDVIAEHRKKAEAYEAEIAAMPIRPEMIAAWTKATTQAGERFSIPEERMVLIASFVASVSMEAAATSDRVYGAKLLMLATAHMQTCGINIAEARAFIHENMEIARKELGMKGST